MRRPKLAVHEYHHSGTHPYYLDLRAFGQGRKFFKTKGEAEAERLRQITLRERGGKAAVGLPLDELNAIMDARSKLAKYGRTIKDAATFYLDHLKRIARCKVTVSELAAEVIAAKKKDGFGAIYVADLKKRLNRFSRDFGSRTIATITVEELDNWLRNLDCAPKTRMNVRTNVGVLFSYAEKRGMIDFNPIRRTAAPKLIDKAPGVFTVDELSALLNQAQSSELELVPMLAIAAFTGLRDAEIKRLDWSEVDLKRGYVEVKALKAKSARRRLVRIQPNLAQWLLPHAGKTGSVVPVNARKKLDSIRATLKEATTLTHWSHNGLRHSFASYRLAATNDAALVASELGHSSSKMLYSTYREVVLPEEAERYWNIVPKVDDGIIIPMPNQYLEATK
jgi:integrase